MLIERLQVEEGFLDGLDLSFDPGLNVVIGPRGSGKTSVIELLRYCFGLDAYTAQAGTEARQHVLSILGSSGRATVTAQIDGERFQVVRSASDSEPRGLPRDRPIVLSQKEIESVGIDAAGRLRIVDAFGPSLTVRSHDSLSAEIRSLTLQIRQLATEVAALEEQRQNFAGVEVELQQARAEAETLTKGLEATAREQARLATIGSELAALSVRRAVVDRHRGELTNWMQSLEHLGRVPPVIEDWPEAAASPDPLTDVRHLISEALSSVTQSIGSLTRAVSELDRLQAAAAKAEMELADEARQLRQRLDALQAGAGGATRRVAALLERQSALSALSSLSEQKRQQETALQTTRLKLLDDLDAARTSRFDARTAIVDGLNKALGPRILVEILSAAGIDEYASAITAALRGSGLHYADLAPLLAERLSPRELVESAEGRDASFVAKATGIAMERSTRVVDQIRTVGGENIITAAVEDAVEFSLLDGKEYKRTEALSTGQRCTVVLPILLRHEERILVVDEPEAHLDNAFIVGTLIHALLERKPTSQLITATHNANIPVLGAASRVILLGSSGERGFVRCAGPLDREDIVEAITTVMEGGREAFNRRAEFYSAHPPE
jgi:energy-coupling factor transporter ATP-binding protein EcfA2